MVYVSEATRSFDEHELRELARRAAEKNERLAITGYLHYAPERRMFFQYLEGECEAVRGLLADIGADARHAVRNTLELGDVGPRHFPGWSMRYLSPETVRAVRLEDVLESVLLTMRVPVFVPEEARRTVLRIVQQLASRELDRAGAG